MSKRSYDDYAHEDDHLCEPDFSLQAFLPHHQTIFYDSDHVHLNYYESSLKKKRFDPPSQSLFSLNNNNYNTTNTTTTNTTNNTNNNITTTSFDFINNNTNTNTTFQQGQYHHHESLFYPNHHHHQLTTPSQQQHDHHHHQQTLYIQSQTIGFDNNSIMEDDQSQSSTTSNSSNIHDSYIYRKHLQHVEYLRATVINQQMNRKNSIINFQVKGLSGQTISFSQVDIESSTLFDLQQIINEQLGIPIPKQRIVLKGRIIPQSNNLQDTRLCEIIGIENNCIFQIVCALKGG